MSEKLIEKISVNYNPFELGKVSKVVPTTPAQKEMWASIRIDPKATLCYNETVELELSGVVNVKFLQLAFQEIINRHDALRSNISADGNSVFIKEDSTETFKVVDLTNSHNSKEDYINCKLNLMKQAVSVEKDCLFHGVLYKTAFNEYKLLIYAHHIVCDGWSYSIILSELSHLYNCFLKNEIPDLSEPLNFSDFAQLEYSNGLDINSKRYWENEFKTYKQTKTFETDFKRPMFRSFESERIDLEIDAGIVESLKKVGIKNGASFYTTLVSAFSYFIHRKALSSEVIIGLSSATQPALENNLIVGHLVNLLPYKVNVNGDLTFIDFLKINKKQMLDAFENQFYTYGELLKNLKNFERTPGLMPLVNVVFNIDQQAINQGISFEGIKAHYQSVPRTHENFEIFINAVSRGNFLSLETQYNSSLFKRETIELWLLQFKELLKYFSENSDRKLHTAEHVLPNLNTREKDEIVDSNLKSFNVNELKFDQVLSEELKFCFSKILFVDSVNQTDNFFSLGGHSLLAVELINLLKNNYGREISMKDIFECPTVELLTDRLLSSHVSKNNLQKIKKTNELKSNLSHSQMQVWYIEEIDKHTSMHNLPSAIKLNFKIEQNKIEWAINQMIEIYPAFRTKIILEKGRPRQVVEDIAEMQLPIKISRESVASEAILKEILDEEAKYRFNKEKPGLFKVKIYDLPNNESVLFFMVHHAIWDGWCFDIFFEQLNVLYTFDQSKNVKDYIAAEKYSFIDYTFWLEEEINSGRLNNQKEYWKNKLKGQLPILNLPTDFNNLSLEKSGSVVPFTLEAKLSDSLKEYAQKNSTSLFNVLLTAFKVVLSKMTKEEGNLDDLIVGSPVRGREDEDLLNTIGYFVNTVAIRSELNFDESFAWNLKSVSKNALEAFSNQTIPFQIILNELEIDRNNDRPPVFQAFFSYQDVSNRKALLNNQKYSQINVDKASTHSELDLWIKTSNEKIEGGLEYRSDLFHEDSAKSVVRNLIYVLEEVVRNKIPKLSKLGINQVDRNTQIIVWNNTEDLLFDSRPFFYKIDEIAEKFPSKKAIICRNGELNYSDLKRQSDKFAAYLLSNGVKSGDLIGISISRNTNLLIGILGILKAGAGYVPLDPYFPKDRLDYMISNSNLDILVTEKSFAGKFNQIRNIINLDEISFTNEVFNLPKVENSQTAYVIYTSGSTGLPKGVELGHLSVSNFLYSMNNFNICSAEDRLLAVTTLSFDIAVLELYLPLINGASIYLADNSEVVDGNELVKIINNFDISVMQATPTTWRLLLHAGFSNKLNFRALCGGEAFPLDLKDKLLANVSRVLNMYGPTETTVWSSVKEFKKSDKKLTIGKPIANTTMYILDENLNMVPIGSTGQLFIGGMGLSKGYLNRPDLTKERFFYNPNVASELIYATGDLARFTFDGEIICLGRNDGQVKVRGFRIELGEIESALSKIDGVNECCVVTHKFSDVDVRLVAFYSTASDLIISDVTFKNILGKSLTSYMIPNLYIKIDQLPKTLNNKIDKKSLPFEKLKNSNFKEEITKDSLSTKTKSRSSDSQIEKLRLIWKNILKNDDILDEDNFFDLGGNSILAVELISTISEQFDLDLQLSTLLETKNFIEFSRKLFPLKNEVIDVVRSDLVPHVKSIFKSLVTINNLGTKNPMFCFHGVGGNVLNYIALIPALKKERPLYAFQSIGLDGETEPLTTVEDMALSYYRELKIAQPEGPYLLSGGSMGGLIALEVARLILESGEEVEKLIMFDTFGPNFDLSKYQSKRKVPILKRLCKGILNKLRLVFNFIHLKVRRNIGLKIPMKALLFDIEHKNYQAIWSYNPKVYNGDIYLVRSHITKDGWYSDPNLGWKKTIKGNIYISEISGSHERFIESPELVKTLSKLV